MNQPKTSSTESNSASSEEMESIRIYFVPLSKDLNESLLVSSDPMTIPSSTSLKGLSLIVNHLLSHESQSENKSDIKVIPFDFLIKGSLVRTSIDKYIRKYGLNIESPLEIKYFKAKDSPVLNGVTPLLSDWITAMDHDDKHMLFIGTYDGMIGSFMTKNGRLEERQVVRGHNGPIQCVDCETNHGNVIVASGSMDQTLLTHILSPNDKNSSEASLSLHCRYTKGHSATISSISLMSPNKESSDIILASGDWNGKLCVWKTSSNFKTSEDSSEDNSLYHNVKDISPIFKIDAHADNISGLTFGTNHHEIVITSSWDHCIKLWDVQTQNMKLSLNGSKVVTDISKRIDSDIIVSGHPDCTVKLWDMRKNNDCGGVGKIFDSPFKRSHKSWVTSVKWSKINPYSLSSSSHDGTIKVWDIRSSLPLYTIHAQDNGHKVLCHAYASNMIYGGGTECVVRSFKF